MLEVIGVKTVHICTSTNDTKCTTVTVIITADGTVLPSTLILKGKPEGRIAKTDFATYLTTHNYKCQENTWMDECIMLSWDNVLPPYIETAPNHIVPLLILVSY